MTFVPTTQFQQQVKGSVLTPDDAGYEQARLAWNRTTDHHPALILIAESADDIVAGVNFAREAGLGICIQSTGHGNQFPADNALMIVTSRMDAVQVDVEARTARVEAGVIWKQVLDVATPHGLAPLLGSSPHVGVIGYTLGGGIGWLARRYGFAGDSVRWIDIVTPDGVLRHTSPTENSELFWGLRGGGGNFGVVTAIEFELYPVATLYGGSLSYPGEVAGDALRFFREWIKTVPDELTSSIAILKFPNIPQMPEAMRGKIQVAMHAAYTGDASEGAAYIQQWLDWQTPTSNTFAEIPFAQVGTISNDPTEPTAGYGSHETLNTLPDEVINLILRYTTDAASPLMVTELRHAGGAITRVAPDANAIGNRDAQLFLQTAGMAATHEMYEAVKAQIARYKHDLRPFVRGGVYLNFMKGDEGAERVKDGYLPETYERLVALKKKVDPDNLFRFSFQLVAR